MAWYKFTPPGLGMSDPSDHTQYTLIGNSPPICIGTRKVGAIQAMDNMGYPIMSIALYREIIKAQCNHYNSVNVLLSNT